MIAAAEFQELRPYLFSIAYRMLGSASEADDVLQDAWLRTSVAPAQTHSPRAWLTTVVSRLCIDRLKSARVAREHYAGPWLPEPVPSNDLPDLEQSAMRHESVTVAFLVLLETLTPAERAAFLLREVFDYYQEVMCPGFLRMYWGLAADQVGRSLFPLAPRVRSPVRIVWGDRDHGAGMGEGVRELDAALPRSELRVLEGAGHALAAERPAELAALIREFLLRPEARLPGAAR